jgi:hypothetical protein
MAPHATLDGKRVLLAGGYGMVGTQVAHILRRHHPGLALVIAGRNRQAAEALAGKLGNADAARIDMKARNPLEDVEGRLDAVATLVKDHEDCTLRAAIARATPYMDIARGGQAQARAYVAAAQHDMRTPVLFASNWMAGVPAIITMHLAARLESVDTIALSILFCGNDRLGPDSEDASSTLGEPVEARVNGRWTNRAPMGDPITVRFPGGLKRRVYRMAMADGITLAQATGARDVAVRLGLDDVMSARFTRFLVRTGLWAWLQDERRAGLRKRLTQNPAPTGAAHEIVIEVRGQGRAGKAMSLRASILDPAGQSHLTAIGAAAGIERLLGFGKEALRPGPAVPETAPDPERLIALLKANGVQLELP